MTLLTLDFESFYSTVFSLSKLTTEEYIRDARFETIGVSVQVNAGEPLWFSGPKAAVKKFLDQFPWNEATAVAHNAMFDMAILNWHFDIRPKRIVDTMSMARALVGSTQSVSLKALAEYYGVGVKGNEVIAAKGMRRADFTPEELSAYGNYCNNDTSLCYQLFEKMLPGFPRSELRLIDLTIRMFTEPVFELDRPLLEKHLGQVQRKKEAMLARVEVHKDQIMSNPQLALLLTELGVDPPMKTSLTTGKETFAFAKSDEEFLELLEHPDLRVQTLVGVRLGVKSTLEETRTQRFIDISGRGLMPIPLRYYAAHTGRWGGSDKVNLQNLPRRSAEKKSPLKQALRAPPGYVVIDSDSSQIEARTLAWWAEQGDLTEAFANGDDVYKQMANKIYSKPEAEISKIERHVGKTTVLGAGYGVGGVKLKATLKTSAIPVEVSEDEAKGIISTYRETYSCIPQLWAEGDAVLEAILEDKTTTFGRAGVLTVLGSDGILLPNGMRITYPNLRKEKDDDGREGFVYDGKRGKQTVKKYIWGGGVVENVCQALARIIIGEQMLMISRRYRVAMTVHDSIVAVVPEEQKEEAQAFIETCMKVRPKWCPDLPLNCEAGSGESYGDC